MMMMKTAKRKQDARRQKHSQNDRPALSESAKRSSASMMKFAKSYLDHPTLHPTTHSPGAHLLRTGNPEARAKVEVTEAVTRMRMRRLPTSRPHEV